MLESGSPVSQLYSLCYAFVIDAWVSYPLSPTQSPLQVATTDTDKKLCRDQVPKRVTLGLCWKMAMGYRVG